MSKAFVIKTDKETVKEPTGGGLKLIREGGIYDIVINWASLDVSKGGAESINFNITYEGNEQTLYGPYYMSKEGKEIQSGMRLINNLGIIAGLQEGEALTVEEEEKEVGADKEVKTFAVVKEFENLPVKVKVRDRYGKNPKNGEITHRLEILKFFREDGATAEEIVNGAEPGKQYEFEKERPIPPKYEDGLTEADVKAWKESKDKAKDSKADSKPKAAPRRPSFARK